MRVSGPQHVPAALPPGKRPATHCTGGRVGPRHGLNGCRKSCPPLGIDPRTVQPVRSLYNENVILSHMLSTIKIFSSHQTAVALYIPCPDGRRMSSVRRKSIPHVTHRVHLFLLPLSFGYGMSEQQWNTLFPLYSGRRTLKQTCVDFVQLGNIINWNQSTSCCFGICLPNRYTGKPNY
jgi:hypothetical protein